MAIRTARAVVEEVPAAAGTSLGSLAACHEDHSERDTQRLSQKYGLKLPLPLSELSVGDEQIPFIKMTDWANFILQRNLWYRLCGLDGPDDQRCSDIWRSFWHKYRKINPDHEIFQREGHDFGRTCGLMLHGDEGRSLRKSPLMVISTHSILGFGLSTTPKKRKSAYLAQKLNYEQPTWTTRFLMSVLPKRYYSEDDDGDFDSDPFQDLMLGVTRDLRTLYDHGISTRDGRFFFCVLNVMGDWPFIQKCGALGRSFMNISKAASSKAPAKGICHLCQADIAGVEWEKFDERPPKWLPTVNTLSPFLKVPAVLELPKNPLFPESFFAFDLFHSWHIGCGKTFLSSCLAVLSQSTAYEGSVDLRLENLTRDFLDWSRASGMKCQLRKINKAKLGWNSMTTYPAGTWSKGSTTTCLMKFFIAICGKYLEHVRANLLLQLAHCAAERIDFFISSLYKWELWIPADNAKVIAAAGVSFLKLHGKAVQLAHDRSQLYFLLMPNYHRMDHIIWDLESQAEKARFVMNPLYASCQSDEDYIGRPSRISRRVSPRLTIQRTLERSLQAGYAQYVKIGAIIADEA